MSESPSKLFAAVGAAIARGFVIGLLSSPAPYSAPWYAARGPRDPWATAEVRRSARLARRATKRAEVDRRRTSLDSVETWRFT